MNLHHPSNTALPSLHRSGEMAYALATGSLEVLRDRKTPADRAVETQRLAREAVWRYRTGRGAELTFADRVAQPLASRLAGADKAGTMSLFHALPTHEQKYYRELALIAIDAYEAAKQQGEIA